MQDSLDRDLEKMLADIKNIPPKGKNNELEEKLEKYRKRRRVLLVWLVVEFLVWMIVNYEFFPIFRGIGSTICEFFDSILFWTGLKYMGIYPLLAWAVPRIVPIWTIVSCIQIWVTKHKINHPKQEKKMKTAKKKDKTSKKGVGLGPLVNAMHGINAAEAANQLKVTQVKCKPLLKSDECSVDVDQGLWVCYPFSNTTAKKDTIYPWKKDGTIDIQHNGRPLHF